MAFGLSALIMSMFSLSKVILGIQTAFMQFMILQNAVGLVNFLQTKDEFKPLLEEMRFDPAHRDAERLVLTAVVGFVLNGVWYLSVVFAELRKRQEVQ